MSSIFKKKEETPEYDLGHLSVLLVEDSSSMQNLISSMLRTFGVREVLICNGAREAISLLTITQARKKNSDIRGIDIVLTDWLMPEGSGMELLDWIRSHTDESISFLPVILLSAYTTEKVIAEGRDHGANEALVKPVSGKKLASRLISVIEKPRPFIKTPTFFGPDRRRQNMPFAGEDRRKTKTEEIEAHHEQF